MISLDRIKNSSRKFQKWHTYPIRWQDSVNMIWNQGAHEKTCSEVIWEPVQETPSQAEPQGSWPFHVGGVFPHCSRTSIMLFTEHKKLRYHPFAILTIFFLQKIIMKYRFNEYSTTALTISADCESCGNTKRRWQPSCDEEEEWNGGREARHGWSFKQRTLNRRHVIRYFVLSSLYILLLVSLCHEPDRPPRQLTWSELVDEIIMR